MDDNNKKKRLGRGLDALLGDYTDEPAQAGVQEVDIDLLDTNPNQPRKAFDEDRLKELSESLSRHGVVQPIIVRQCGSRYTIIAGERRFRAARMAGLRKVPIVVREIEDAEVMEIALIENIQREDLNPIEEAAAMRFLMEQHDLTQEELAKRLAKSRPAIANTVRLLNLPQEVQSMIKSGALTAGHARAIGGIDDPAALTAIAREIADKKLSVREAENRARAITAITKPVKEAPAKKPPQQSSDLTAAADRMRDKLGTRVSISGDESRGKIIIEYYTPEGLQSLYDAIVGE